MKISVADIKKALLYIEKNSLDVEVDVKTYEHAEAGLYISLKNKYGQHEVIRLAEDSRMLAKVTKEETI